MALFKKILSSIFGSKDREIKDRDGFYFYIRCDKCGTPVRVRVNKHNDFLLDYDSGERVLRKEVMDGGCFSLMYATIRIDGSYNIIDQEVEGGEFITWDEYRELTQPKETSTDAE